MELNTDGYKYLISKDKDEAIMKEVYAYVLSQGELESKEKTKQREMILEYIQGLLNVWIKECFREKYFSDEVIERASGLVYPYGSFALKICSVESDMDLVCIVPGEITDEDYFSSFFTFLSNQERIKNLNAIPLAKVPLIGCQIDGINVDLPMVSVQQCLLEFPPSFSIFDDSLDKTMGDSYALSLNGPRTAKILLDQIQDKEEFALLVATIRFIIKKRLCYKTIYGYLGGIHIAIMVCKILKLTTGSSLYILNTFFDYYAQSLGNEIISLNPIPNEAFEMKSPLIILTPAKLLMNSARGTTRSTLRHIQTQFRFIVNQIVLVAQQIQPVNILFLEYPFFEEFPMYIQIDVTTEKEEDFEDWVGFVESKLRLLTIFINKGINVIPYPKRIVNPASPLSTRFLLGLSILMNSSVIDLSYEINSFIDILRLSSLSISVTIREQLEGMTVSITATQTPNM